MYVHSRVFEVLNVVEIIYSNLSRDTAQLIGAVATVSIY